MLFKYIIRSLHGYWAHCFFKYQCFFSPTTYTYDVFLVEAPFKSRSGMVKMKPLLGSIKGVPTFSQQYEDPIPEYNDGTSVVYDNHRHMQSAQQPGATSVGYPPLYPRTNPKVPTNG
jgi:hypothetical protein